MTDRETLIALIDKARYGAAEMCHRNGCKGCSHWDDRPHCRNSFIADHLIANGVVVREKGEWDIKHRHHGGFRRYTGRDDFGEEHTITVDERSECDEPYCPKCGKWNESVWRNFCPNCGADMRKGENG